MNFEKVVLLVSFVALVVCCAVQHQLGYEQQEQFKIEIEEYQQMTKEAQDRTEEALDMVDTWKTGYRELQEEHSQALEYIEQLEYETEMLVE